jgi:hypothetical protein
MAGSQLQSNQFERRAPEGYAEWLSNVPWKLYGTFTFAWKVSDQQGDKVFHAFINRMERHLGCDIAWVRGDEKRWSGCGMPGIPRHYHALFWSAAPLDRQLFETQWTSLAGDRRKKMAGTGREGMAEDQLVKPGAKVDPYDPKRNAIAYVLKLINTPEGDWQFRKLELAVPAWRREPATCRQRRWLRRHHERVEAFRESC